MENQRKDQDKSLKSGERQVSDNLNQIETYHKERYKKACNYIRKADIVMDLGCGCGYGSNILSKKAKIIISIDDSHEAINYARTYWSANNIHYFCKDVLHCKEVLSKSLRPDVIVAFEIIEHIKDTEKLFEIINELTRHYIIFSVPSKEIPLKRSKWHWKHFDYKEIEQYLRKIGFKIGVAENINKTWFVVAERGI